MNLPIEIEQEYDGRWIAEIDELDGVGLRRYEGGCASKC